MSYQRHQRMYAVNRRTLCTFINHDAAASSWVNLSLTIASKEQKRITNTVDSVNTANQ